MSRPVTGDSDFYTYTLDSSPGTVSADGDISEVTGKAPFMAEYVVPVSGHPAGTIYAWVMNDAQNLYITFDVTPDNTMDGDQDYVKAYIKLKNEVRVFKVSVPETTWGVPGFISTERADYLHKVYELAIPLSEIEADSASSTISLAFAAYGTMAAPVPITFRAPVSYLSGGQPYGITTGRFNNDDNLDIVSINSNENILSVLLGNGNGTFASRTTSSSIAAGTWVDTGRFNNDTYDDLAITCSSGIAVQLANGDGTFAAPVLYGAGTSPNTVVVADFNNDTNLDLAVTNNDSDNVSILLGTGSGTFGTASNIGLGSNAEPSRMVAADLNKDGRTDLAIVCGDRYTDNKVIVLLGNIDASYTLKPCTNTGDSTTVSAIGITAAELDNDTNIDLALAHFENNPSASPDYISTLIGDGTGGFTNSVYGWGTFDVGNGAVDITSADFNGDGYIDLASTNRYSSSISVLANRWEQTLQQKADFPTGSDPMCITTGDFNNDLKPDLAATTVSGNVAVLINNTGLDAISPSWDEGSDLIAGDISSTSLTLNWPSASDNIDVAEYKIFVNNIACKTVSSNVTSTTLEDLTPGAIAVCRVEAGDMEGNWSTTGPKTIAITKPEGNWTDTSAAYSHGQAIAGDGTLWGWGQNSVGQIGDNTTVSKTSPVNTSSGNQWASVVSGEAHSLALKNDGTLWAWGDNTFGQTGADPALTEQRAPVQVGTGTTWTAISAGYQFSAAIESDGTLWTWGRPDAGKLGIGDVAPEVIKVNTPTKVGTDTDWISVSLGESHALALKSDGTLWSWGHNGMGQLGTGTNPDGSIKAGVSSPVQVGTDDDWIAISAGNNYSLALKSDGTLWAWGDNEFGILAREPGSPFWVAVPVQIGADTDWAAMEAGVDHVLAIKQNGSLWAWGNNYSNQLGTLPVEEARATPTRIGIDNNWCKVSAGSRDSYALKSDGTLWTWGQNGIGQLGDGTTTSHLNPAEITTGADVTAPHLTAGTVARTSDTQGTVKFTSDEAGQYYYAIVADGAEEPAIDTSGAGTACTTAETTIANPTGLTAGAKDIYIKVKDAAGNASSALKIDIAVYTAPSISPTPTATPAPVVASAPAATPTPVLVVVTEIKKDTNVSTTASSIQYTAGIGKAALDSATAQKLYEEALKASEKGQETTVEVKAPLQSSASGLDLTLPGSSWNGIANKTDANVQINAGFGMVTFDEKATEKISDTAQGKDVTIHIEKVDTASLSQKVKDRVGEHPVFKFGVLAGSSPVTQFGGGKARICIPYTLKPGENKNAIVAYYVDNDGKLKVMIGRYHEDTGTVCFETTHFSYFALGHNTVAFKDVLAGAWYKDAVDFIAAREITEVTEESLFKPGMKLTRGEFIVMLMRAYGIEPDSVPEDNFADAGNAIYTNYLSAAKRLKIAMGAGNNMFLPEKEITRQEMFTLLYNALKVIGKLPAAANTVDVNTYTDASQIAAWARDSMTSLAQAGIIKGSGSKLNPTGTTTHAEMAQVLYNLLMKE
jgi:alpha-tubulin suppressor-like RCC1 family protein